MEAPQLYIMTDFSWESIKEKIEFMSDYDFLEQHIAIYDFRITAPHESYAILSTHKDIDKILEEFPVNKIGEDDAIRTPIKQNKYELLFGSRDVKDLL